ncbi:MAG: FprA family A-type flavoprotein [Bacteroidales bacterium]|jgi:flavorubredoxin|nr:FprA family A-type flavoprotein [Bacteroidales bacterium]MDD3100716.1 FprA family A-type flavoprotein [Bacteroidales bacterium]MDD3944074.1 FprA family A-type flavoprotein [Bacteroidales bacterium]MDD4481255.1 FprA family A-type flavoprotein [Bacteroidales bacterium]MDD5315025.1 FprA family A-type flavoprotein [Bacteroidales bacterium]
MTAKILDTLHFIGTNDRNKTLFESNWPLPFGISYNSYLITDKKTALLDTIEYGSDRSYFEDVAAMLNGRDLDYLVILHMEPDHAGMIGELLQRYPSTTVVTNARALKLLDIYFPCVDKSRTREVKEGDSLDLGHHKLQFVMTPMVHWPESMMAYCTTEQILFSQDAFGTFGTLDGGIFDDEINLEYYKDEMLRYYTNIIGRFSAQVAKALQKASTLPIRIICPVHGPVWRTDPKVVFDWYSNWAASKGEKGVVLAYATMYSHTQRTTDYIARKLSENGIRDIRVFNVSNTHPSFILREIWKYNGLVLGSCSYNTGMHPNMHHLCHEIEIMQPGKKKVFLFGGYSWSGGGLKHLQLFAQNMQERHQWELLNPGTELAGYPAAHDLAGLDPLIASYAATL